MRTREEILAPRVHPITRPWPPMRGIQTLLQEPSIGSYFSTPLRIQKTGEAGLLWWGKAQWVLTAPLIYRSEVLDEYGADPTIVVPEGFETDLTSAPRLPLVFLFAGDTAHAPAAIHDYLYRGKLYSRAVADAVMNEAMAVHQPELGIFAVPTWRRWLMVGSLRAMGWYVWNRITVEEVA